MSNKIDYLHEDPEIPSQRFALVTIVGPHMPQKCDTWGLKVRGAYSDIEKAKEMSQKLIKIDNNYDIFIVEVGKFFPLTIEPHEIPDIEYQNDQLNELIKGYLKNKEVANEHWYERKNEMVEDAIKYGKTERGNEREHPIALLQKMINYERSIEEFKKNASDLETELQKINETFSTFTEEERDEAIKEFNKISQTQEKTQEVIQS